MEFKKEDWLGPEELTQDIGTLRSIVNNLTELQSKDGKKYLDKLLRLRYNQIMASIALAPMPNLDACLAQEYEKGRAIECIYQESLVENLIAVFKEQIRDLQIAQNEEEEYYGE